MLLRADLGFLCSAVLVVIGWLTAHRKWRRVVARREEIRRLLAFAAEEAARDEFAIQYADTYKSYEDEPVVVSSGSGFSPDRNIQYQCEVCFCPTTTRCKRCKAVRYCSGKCQIIHWRQGHKDECRSFTTHPNTDVGVYSYRKEFNQGESLTSGNINGIEVRPPTKPVESLLNGKIEYEVESIENGKETDINVRSLLSENPILTKSENVFAGSNVSYELKSVCIDSDEQSEFFTSSSSSTTSSEEHSLSEPSTSSSDFWEGTVEPIRSKINTHDEIGDPDVSSSCSSSGRINAHVEVDPSNMNSAREDDPRPTASLANNLTDEAALSEEVNEDNLKLRGTILSNSQTSKPPSSSGHESKTSMKKGNGPNKDVSEVSSMRKTTPKVSEKKINQINGPSCVSDTVRCQEKDSSTLRAPESHLSSSIFTKKHAITRHGSLGAQNGTMSRFEGSFPYEMFVHLYNWNKVELRPRGLVNCGNSCYANAVLQCLAFTPPLTAFFLQGLHSKTCEKRDSCVTCEFERLVKNAKEGNHPISPLRVISQMQRIGSNLGNGREEDAHEFLRYAIVAMQLVCLNEAGVNSPSSLHEETTLIGLTFGGYLQSKIECLRCGGKSEQRERIMDLTVEIGRDIGTLEEALRQFTHSEILDGENKYHCGRCKSYEKAKKKLSVMEAPNVLTIALKRFQSGKYGKLNNTVKFPDILNLAPYMRGTSDKSPIYRLYGVVVHLDVMSAAFSGHYVCYIKNNQGMWFKADDSTVQVVELEKVLQTGAYMLLYARCSPRAPRVIRSSMAQKMAKTLIPKSAKPWVDSMPVHFDHNKSRVDEDDSWSENSSNLFSESESGSYSTESSGRESTSTDENFDKILCDHRFWSKRNSSDFDTSSQSSIPSPPHQDAKVAHSIM